MNNTVTEMRTNIDFKKMETIFTWLSNDMAVYQTNTDILLGKEY